MTDGPAHPFLDHPGPIAFAHRGGAGDWPENTMPAFEAAVGLGFRYLETDAHATADGVVVAFHDEALDRVTDRTGLIRELPWHEVRQARVDGREPIPLLLDLLEAFPDARLNIDPKHDTVMEPLAEILRRTSCLDRICLGAFSDKRLRWFRKRFGPRVCTSAGPQELAALRAAASSGAPVIRTGARCVQAPTAYRGVTVVDERLVRRSHVAGLAVHVWTIDEADEMHRLLDLGVDGIMTDRPSTLRSVLEQRGQWS